MLNKEQIKEMKDYFNECITKDTVYEEDLTISYMKIAKEYIEQLESDKQKLIEKLEKVKQDMKQDQYTEMYYLNDIEEILSILKGENYE